MPGTNSLVSKIPARPSSAKTAIVRPYGPYYPKRNYAARVMVVGPSPSPYDLEQGMWFARPKGNVVNVALLSAHIDPQAVARTSVFSLPSGRDSDQHREWFIGRRGSIFNGEEICLHRPTFKNFHYLKQRYEPEIFRLQAEIYRFDPHTILAFGRVAVWALTGAYISMRDYGASMPCELAPERTVIPTYDASYLTHHPRAFARTVEHAALAFAHACKVGSAHA